MMKNRPYRDQCPPNASGLIQAKQGR